jgi:xanthine dehydrogenase YagT iron-sulfur-binding subunit
MPPPPLDDDLQLSRREFLVTAGAVGLASACATGSGLLPSGADPTPGEPMPLELTVNGSRRSLQIDPRTTLLDLLRENLQLTGTKKGCDMGQCGACTVLVGGTRVNSCLVLAAQCAGREVTTIEGLAATSGPDLHPLQAAFIEEDAFQCGYCTPGQILSGVGFCREPWGDGEDDVRQGMAGNICRCGTYPHILAAVRGVRGKI